MTISRFTLVFSLLTSTIAFAPACDGGSDDPSGEQNGTSGPEVCEDELAAPTSECRVCLADNCCPEYEACLVDSNCTCMLECIEGGEMIGPCGDLCGSNTPITSAAISCAASPCSLAC